MRTISLAMCFASAIVTCASWTPPAEAACRPASSNYSFHGRTSGGKPFGATLTIGRTGAADIRGSLFVAPKYRDTPVEGTIVDGEELVLRNVADGATVFDGWFIDRLDGMGPLGCDFAVGALAGEGPARLQLLGWGFRLDRLTAADQDRLNAVVLDIHDVIGTNDAQRLAAHVRYPIRIVFPQRPRTPVVIADAAAFVRQSRRILGPNLRSRMTGEVPHDPFCRGDDCMMGNGEIWIDRSLRITHLHPG